MPHQHNRADEGGCAMQGLDADVVREHWQVRGHVPGQRGGQQA